jgi:predicted permease
MLSWLAPASHQEEILGDLEEVHRRRAARRGPVAAWFLTSAEALSIGFPLARRTVWLRMQRDMVTGVEARLALRLLARTPLLSLTAVVALTVGIALATTGFTVVNSLLHPRLPIPEGDRVVEVSFQDGTTGAGVTVPLDFVSGLAERSTTLERLGGLREREVNLVSPEGEIELVSAVLLQPGAFPYVPMVPLAGRALEAGDASDGVAGAVVVLSEGIWARRFGRDPAVVGTRLSLGGVEHQVVGVLPATVTFPSMADLWLPLAEAVRAYPENASEEPTRFYALLGEGVGAASAEAELATLVAGPAAPRGSVGRVRARVRGVGEVQGAGFQGGLVVAVLVALLLVIAGNVGNLMVARAAARRPELSIRGALGATRARLVAQLSLEAVALTMLAALLGLWLSQAALARFAAAEAAELPPWLDLRPKVGVAAFVVLIAGLVTAVAGVAPALGATRGTARHHRGGARAFGWFHDAMIVAQIALSVGVLGAAVMVHRGWAQGGRDRAQALPASRIVAAQIALPAAAEAGAEGPSLRYTRSRLESAVGSLVSVIGVGTATFLPGADAPLRSFEVETSAADGGPVRVTAPAASVSEGFFGVVDAGAAAGRLFDAADYDPGAPRVALVNEAFVRLHLSGANAVGRRIRQSNGPDRADDWREIVGVLRGLPMSANDPDRAGGVYLPMGGESTFRLLVRTEDAPSTLASRIQPAAFSVDPGIAVSGIRVLSDVLQTLRRLYLLIASAFSSLGAVVLLLSLMGIYSVLSFEVTRRTNEIGVRVALGAGTTDVLRPVLGRVAAYALVGGGLGSLLGLMLVRLAQATFVMRFPPTGPATFALLVAGSLVAALAAAWMPTRRALSIHPADALRTE